ncbi:MAG: hypothetical protein ACYS21_00445, partial [Planctomycetota bacterium]
MFKDSSQNQEDSVAVLDDSAEAHTASTQVPGALQADDRSTGAPPQQGALRKIQSFRVEFGPSRKDILNFTNQLAVMIRAGISL